MFPSDACKQIRKSPWSYCATAKILGLARQEETDHGRLIEISREATMGELDKQGVMTMQELIASSLAQTDALTKLLIEKGLITQAEFMQKLSAERSGYRAFLRND